MKVLRAARVLLTVGALGAGLTFALAPSAGATTVSSAVVQQASSDALPDFTVNGSSMQHHTEVETDTFAWGSTVVSAFQVGRNSDGYGAQAIGWATSTDNGQTWPSTSSGILPGLSAGSPNPNSTYSVVVNQSVAYDAKHNTWLIPSVGYVPTAKPNQFHEKALLVSRSTNPTNWTSDPVVAVTTNVDKAWGVCDNNSSSPYYGNCYVAYSQIDSGDALAVVTSSDGGQNWTGPVTVPSSAVSPCKVAGAVACGYNTNPVVQPNGTVVLVATDKSNGIDGSTLLSSASTNGGASFSAPVSIATLHYHDQLTGSGGAACSGATAYKCLRTKNKPTVDVDAAGTVYAAWSDDRFRAGNAHDDIVYATLGTGPNAQWSTPQRVGPADTSTDDKVIPGFAVAPGTSGPTAQLSAVYYDIVAGSCATTCKVVPQFTTSYDGGTTWTKPYSIKVPGATNTAVPITWLVGASVNGPRFVGDYLSVSYCHGSPVTVVSLPSKAPTGSNPTTYFENEYALTLPVGFGRPRSVHATAGDASASVSFSPAGYPGGSGISYTVTASPGGASATGTASPITVPNLTNGTSYRFTVTSSDANGNGAASTPSNAVIPIVPTTLSTGSKTQLDYGSSATLRTTLTDKKTGRPLPGKTVQLQGHPASGGAWRTVTGGQRQTSSTGSASVRVSPKANYIYRWHHPATGSSGASTSKSQSVLVRQVVTAKASAKRVSRNSTTKIYGAVTPTAIGHYVALQQYRSGSWHSVGTRAKIKRQRMPDGVVRIGYVLKFASNTSGTKSLRVSRTATSHNAAGHSAKLSITVR